jgi:enoyl-CoA hydratase/carnithine racemase
LVTISRKKVFSSGLDLKQFLAPKEMGNFEYIILINRLFEKFLTLNVPTLAVIDGHTIAAGVMLALCHDRIIMTSDPKTQFVLNELDNGLAMTIAQAGMIKQLLSPQTARMLIMG